MTAVDEPKTVTDLMRRPQTGDCRLDDGGTLHLPAFLSRFIKPTDTVSVLSPGGNDLLIEREQSRPQCFLCTTIGLNISRPSLIQLLEEGKIEYRRVGTHRRVRFEAVLKYKRQMDEQRRAALRELAAYDQELGI